MGIHKLSAIAPLLVLLAAVSSGCQCASPPPSTTAALLPDGERCNSDAECVSGLCAALPNEPAICRKTCSSGCNPVEVCTSFGIGSGGKLRAGCVAEKLGLCQPCTTNADCPYPADVCLSIGGASFCGRDCAYDDQCPEGYVCSDALGADGTPATRQCIPKSASCECLPSSTGQPRPCQVTNAYGTCTGTESCDPARGFGGCDARVPAPETCDGIDDDCNGKIDDGIDPITCGVGECRVTVAGCEGGRVPLCTPKQGTAELCNGKDDDCDTEIDEDFDLTSDPQNCGACGTVCTVKNGTPKCAASACAVDRCNAGYGDCDGQYATGCEASLNTDVNHCGACNNACNLPHANARCAGGTCLIESCEPGWLDADKRPETGCEYQCSPTNGGVEACDGIDNDCDGLTDEDFNFATNKDHCGGCNIKCSVANGVAGCNMGQCVVAACNPGFGDCDGRYDTGCETNTNDTVAHCGGCGQACAPANATGRCVTGACLIQTCNTGFGNCDGAHGNGCEANLNTDAQNCGLCGRGCSVANGVPACVGGQCGIGSCNQPFNDCDQSYASGCESNKTTDLNNCGTCGNSCPNRPNSTRSCTASGCSFTCTAPFQDCNGQAVDGCESNRQTDVDNCGACGTRCPTRANATSICTPTGCSFTCLNGFADCDGNPNNGCEVDTQTSLSHCGACQNSCPSRPNATRACFAGDCSFSCSTGYLDCNGLSSDGCEVNRNSDVNHCGGCNAKCPDRPNSVSYCSSGSCGFTCNTGFNDCDGSAVNGCESDRTSDVANCGACGNACPSRPNASAICTSTGCSFTCNPGFADCDGQAANGCEVNLNTDKLHCGQCNNACQAGANGTATCSNGQCNSSCTAPFADCTAAAGCETNTSSDLNHCGGCNVSCPTRTNATRTCANGTCGYTCNSGYQDCDGQASNGCESNRNTDVNNCGACGTVCPNRTNSSRTCTSGSCGFTCTNGWANCDGNATNGCERNLNTQTGPVCGSPTTITSVSGDVADVPTTVTGTTEGTYRIQITEDSSSCRTLGAKVELTSPSGADYDLRVYLGSCGGSNSATSSSTGVDTIRTCNPDDCFWGDSGYTIWIEVIHWSGAVCSPWTLRVYGNDNDSRLVCDG